MKNFLTFATLVFRETSLLEMAIRSALLILFTSWFGIIIIITTNFDSLMNYLTEQVTKQQYLFEQVAESQVEIDRVLAKTLSELDAVDRVSYSKFHNNITDFEGLHFIYLTRTSEITRPGISNEVRSNQDVPIAVFSGLSQSFLRGECWVYDVMEQDPFGFLGEQGVRLSIKCPVYERSGRYLVGVIGAEMVFDKNINDMVIKEITDKLKDTSDEISRVLYLIELGNQ